MPQPHVYSSFGSKQELFLACWERVYDAVLQRLGTVKDREALFFYQAVASLRDGELGTSLLTDVRELRLVLGEERFRALLTQGASALLGEDAPAPPRSGN